MNYNVISKVHELKENRFVNFVFNLLITLRAGFSEKGPVGQSLSC